MADSNGMSMKERIAAIRAAQAGEPLSIQRVADLTIKALHQDSLARAAQLLEQCMNAWWGDIGKADYETIKEAYDLVIAASAVSETSAPVDRNEIIEECAKVAEDVLGSPYHCSTAYEAARRIRALKTPAPQASEMPTSGLKGKQGAEPAAAGPSNADPQADSLHNGDRDSGNHVQPAVSAPSMDDSGNRQGVVGSVRRPLIPERSGPESSAPSAIAPTWKAVSTSDPTRGVAWIDEQATHVGRIVDGERYLLELPKHAPSELYAKESSARSAILPREDRAEKAEKRLLWLINHIDPVELEAVVEGPCVTIGEAIRRISEKSGTADSGAKP